MPERFPYIRKHFGVLSSVRRWLVFLLMVAESSSKYVGPVLADGCVFDIGYVDRSVDSVSNDKSDSALRIRIHIYMYTPHAARYLEQYTSLNESRSPAANPQARSARNGWREGIRCIRSHVVASLFARMWVPRHPRPMGLPKAPRNFANSAAAGNRHTFFAKAAVANES